jgi:alpha-L-arabinofuranosidase
MRRTITIGLLTVITLNLFAAGAKISVQADKAGHPIPATLWGIFFEDINLSADGGVFPELVRNLSFEDNEQRPDSWRITSAPDAKNEISIDSGKPLNPLNRRSLRLKLNGGAALVNDGYYGMSVVKGDAYAFKVAARATDGFSGPLVVKLVAAGRELASGEIKGVTGDWKYHSLEFTATGSDPKAALQIDVAGQGTLFLDMVSLTPKKVWKKTGLRPDLADAMAGLRPAFLRFPGGCWVEGETMARMYNWKKTIGNVDVRTPLHNIWGYQATHGVGYHEYLQMAEDLGAEPLFCINTGMSHKENAPLDLMDQWVQDALDAIEYANGPTNTVWGGLRARNGHPAPFGLKYLEIGNENGGPAYAQRWPLFVKAIKAKHPEVQLIANHWLGGYPKEPMPEIVDEHYYNTPEWFMQHAHHYDKYDRNGPKIFVGEYAVTRNTGLGNLRGAIGEAAFMTGLERNSDMVIMAAYAPLFCNANHKRWPVNLINFDSSRWFGIPSYYVQKLFAEHRGSVTLPTSVEAGTTEEPLPGGGIGVGTWNTSAEFKDIKVTAPDGRVLLQSDFSKDSRGWKKHGGGSWTVEDGVLRQTDPDREFVRALAGDRSWTDYTLELKARKISGREGFLILFHNADEEDRTWWNLGGWVNSRHGIEMGETLDPKPGRIESGRWYDIKVEARGLGVKCWLDGKLIHEIKNTRRVVNSLFASAARDEKTGDLILKVVNSAAAPAETEITLAGAGNPAAQAQAIVLTSASPRDENTLEEPLKVAPRMETVRVAGPKFTRAFPGNSFTVLRIPASK